MDAPTSSFDHASLIRHRPSLSHQHQASFHESIIVNRKRYSSRQLLTIFTYIYGNFFLAACVSLQAPFFPKEAEKKGATASQYGLVFGAYELAIIFVSPLVGKLVGTSSPRTWIQMGLFLTGLTTIFFGLIDRLPDGAWFLSMAFIIRILEGVGAASFTTPSYTATAEQFPNDQATILSLLETSFGLGLICGPTLGGWLYELGDYSAPFAVLGTLLLLGGMLSVCVQLHPSEIEPRAAIEDGANDQASYLLILLSPGIALDALSVVTSLNFIGYNAATLEPHLRQFDLSVMHVGLVFVITGSIYALTTPIWGNLCNKVDTRLLCLLGCLLSIIGFALIGPLPLFNNLEPSLALITISLALIGIGAAIKLVAALVGSFKYAIKDLGMPDNKSTFGVCSSIYHTSTSIGAFVGPSIGGFLLDNCGYRSGTYLLFASELLLIVFYVIFLVHQRFCLKTPAGYDGFVNRHGDSGCHEPES